ncbi:unnamed protein product [Aphanomyces euteiches]
MLDIGRSKVPKLETLYQLVDMMANLKLNQLQLYMEGFPFAYDSYPDVWKGETPITGEEIIRLDRYCQDRFIDMVPNQNSFGHMAPWLFRTEFNDLAERPGGVDAPWGWYEKPFTLNPLDPGSMNLIKETHDDFLPYFSSKLFNAGCDETFDLGQERSKEICDKLGTGRVYLDFVLKVHEQVKKNGKQMMIWGDIIKHHPELLSEFPKDILALEWGYDKEAPAGKMGQFVLDLGNYYQSQKNPSGMITCAITTLYFLQLENINIENDTLPKFEQEDYANVLEYVSRISVELDLIDMQAEDAKLIEAEFRFAVRLISHGAKLGMLKYTIAEAGIEQQQQLEWMIDELDLVINEFRHVWLQRNRSGGLGENLYKLGVLKKQYMARKLSLRLAEAANRN